MEAMQRECFLWSGDLEGCEGKEGEVGVSRVAENRPFVLESGRAMLWLRAKSLQDNHTEAGLETLLIPTLSG